MSIRSCLGIAFEALARNRLQSALTMIGITIGVATVLTMVAVGSGARAAIDQQIRAAGMNLIVVRAGNYKVKTEDDFGGVVDHQAAAETTEETERTALHRETEQQRRTGSGLICELDHYRRTS
jgi:ABC-type lipoprotein release transport system permease subunit